MLCSLKAGTCEGGLNSTSRISDACVLVRQQGLINNRNKKLELLVNAAAGPAVPLPHSRRSPLERIDLREEACCADAANLGNGPALDLLPDISEDGAEGESPLTHPLTQC